MVEIPITKIGTSLTTPKGFAFPLFANYKTKCDFHVICNPRVFIISFVIMFIEEPPS
eukprot:c24264_g1_i1 orf=3-170(-)